MSKPLHGIVGEMQALWPLVVASLDDGDGSVSPELAERLAKVQDDLETRVAGCVRYMRHLEAQEAEYQEEMDYFKAKRDQSQRHREHFKDYVKDCLEAAGLTELSAPPFHVRIQKSPPSIATDDVSLIPEKFWIEQAPKLDAKAAIAALKSGEAVPGCRLTQGTHLRIT